MQSWIGRDSMTTETRRFFVTGTAGFIGYHLASRLLREGHAVTGYDGMTTYYDVELKRRRHELLRQFDGFVAHEAMLEEEEALDQALAAAEPDVIVHLAAQAGVRYSLEKPRAYVNANLVGTFNLLEQARQRGVQHLLLASTSSVYGANIDLPFAEHHRTAHPLTLYAATKEATEGMAHAYAHLFDIPTTVFRFFTVYGPWGRPDMALFKFTDAALRGLPLDVYNNGLMERDFTYIDDLVEAIIRLVALPPSMATAGQGSQSRAAPFRVINIGNNQPVGLLSFIEAIEEATGRETLRNYMPMQQGDVLRTWADTSALSELTGFVPSTPVRQGVAAFVDWYRGHYHV
jgi:UDP-glucuronate 4-epimerase